MINKEEEEQEEDDDDASSPSPLTSSGFYRELEKDILLHGISDRDIYSGNRALIVLGDFFYDDLTAREYERGLLIKGKHEFLGKTIVLSRNAVNHLLAAYCAISGLGVYHISCSVSWSGPAERHHIDNLMQERRNNPQTFMLDVRLCRLLKSQESWKYTISDLERVMDGGGEEMLLA